VVSQKTLTGHAKGGAAAFQLIGLCQVLGSGIVPPNRSLDCVDGDFAEYPRLVWTRERPLRFGEAMPLRAGLLTSLGFGHVAGLIAVAHPEAFVAALPAERRDGYRTRAAERPAAGARRLAQAMGGGAGLDARPGGRARADSRRRWSAARGSTSAPRAGGSTAWAARPRARCRSRSTRRRCCSSPAPGSTRRANTGWTAGGERPGDTRPGGGRPWLRRR